MAAGRRGQASYMEDMGRLKRITEEDLPEDPDFGWTVVIMILCIYGMYRCCCTSCGRAGEQVVPRVAVSDSSGTNDFPALLSQVKAKKSTFTAYVLLIISGFVGAHHFYLDRLVHGLVAMCSLNFFLFGSLLDLLLIPWYVKEANKSTAECAPKDSVGQRLLWRLPLTYGAVVVLFMALFTKLPSLLNNMGVVDIDARLAGTGSNPYTLLGVERGAPRNIVDQAFEARLQELVNSRTCQEKPKGHACREKQELLSKAAAYALWQVGPPRHRDGRQRDRRSNRKLPEEDDETWADRLNNEWAVLGNITKENFEALAQVVQRAFEEEAGPDSSESS